MTEKSGLRLQGHFDVNCYREGNLIWEEHVHNIITNEGLTRILNVMFQTATDIPTWYCALVETTATALATANYDVPIYTECSAYDEAARVIFTSTMANTQLITNSPAPAVFTISDTKTIYGAAIVSTSTKGDHTAAPNNVLFCDAAFSTNRAVVDNDVINLTYSITAADDGA
jgi:hypothetical protein